MTTITASLKDKAQSILLDGIARCDYKVIQTLVSENCIQHDPYLEDGRGGLLKQIGLIEYGQYAGNPIPKITIKRAFQDGDFVILHSQYSCSDCSIVFDIFRFDDEQVAEQWSCTMDESDLAGGRSLMDGASEVQDLDKTEINKAIIRSFLIEVFINGNHTHIRDYFHPDIIQHNPFIPDPIAGFLEAIENFQQEDFSREYEKIHMVLGEGNFVLTVCEGLICDEPAAFYDLFRLEESLVMEHWNILQRIPQTMSHRNGMF